MDAGLPYEAPVNAASDDPDASAPAPQQQRLVAGVNKSMLIDPEGTLWATGSNAHGALGIGGTADRRVFVKIRDHVAAVAGNAHSTLILDRDGTLYGCGANTDVRVWWQARPAGIIDRPVPIMSGVRDVAAGVGHYVVLKQDGTVWTWGRNDYGELGDGTTVSRLTPVQVMSNAVAVQASGYSTYVRKADTSLWGFGWNAAGQLGIGSVDSKREPVKILREVADFDAWIDHAAAVTPDGVLLAWGGDAGTLPRPVLRNVVRVETGDNLTGILGTDDSLWLWGRNAPGGNLQPKAYLEEVADVSLAGHAMVLKKDGSVWTWGDNTHGQLGNNTTLASGRPVRVVTGLLPASVMTSDTPTTGTDNPDSEAEDVAATSLSPEPVTARDETVPEEALPDEADDAVVDEADDVVPDEADDAVPETAPASSTQVDPFQALAVNDLANYFLRADGTLWGWGWNGGPHIGALGLASSQFLQGPVLIAKDIVAVEASGLTLVGLSRQGELWRWGAAAFDLPSAAESLFAGTQPAPTRLREHIVAFSMGKSHLVAVDREGILWGWGRNDFHQMGPLVAPASTQAEGGSPGANQAVKLMENVASASAGAYHTVVLKQDGSVWQLGVTTTDLQDDGAPTHVMDGMASVSAGDACSAAIGADGSLWTWGLNHDGRLGTGDTAHGDNRSKF
jgi:alpha-tubulin suppressor-like RCC1 family protein